MNRIYPQIEIDLQKFRENASAVITRCQAAGIQVCGVIKGCNSLPPLAQAYRDCGAVQLASSRMEQITACREAGIPGPYLLLRIPMLSEVPEVVRWCDMSLNSETAVLDVLNEEAGRQKKQHQVIVMADLGDLREGFWSHEELIAACLHVERHLPHLHLAGIGVNLGCYGSIVPTPEKMQELVELAEQVESRIGRRLEIISGGATSSYTLVHWGTMPPRINHLRIGEGVLLARDLQTAWDIHDMKYLHMDTMRIRAEVIEMKTKPSYPVGEIGIDAFGRRPTYTDRGMRKRALLGIGRADVGELEQLIPCDEGIEVLGGASDHCILDVENCPRDIQVGDVIDFYVTYSTMLYATASRGVHIRYLHA